MPTSCNGAAGGGAGTVATAAVALRSSCRLAGAGLAGAGDGGATRAIGPEDAAFCATGGEAGGGGGAGGAHPLSATMAMPQIVRFNVFTLMSGPATEWRFTAPISIFGRFLLVDFVAVHWSTTQVWLTCDKAVEEL